MPWAAAQAFASVMRATVQLDTPKQRIFPAALHSFRQVMYSEMGVPGSSRCSR